MRVTPSLVLTTVIDVSVPVPVTVVPGARLEHVADHEANRGRLDGRTAPTCNGGPGADRERRNQYGGDSKALQTDLLSPIWEVVPQRTCACSRRVTTDTSKHNLSDRLTQQAMISFTSGRSRGTQLHTPMFTHGGEETRGR